MPLSTRRRSKGFRPGPPGRHLGLGSRSWRISHCASLTSVGEWQTVLIIQTPYLNRVCREEFYDLSTTSSTPVVYLITRFHMASRRGLARFVGRQRELELRQRAWEQAQRGQG